MIEPTDEMVQLIYERIDFVNHGDDGIREGLAAVLALLERDYRALLEDLADPDPCRYDHHGYCQAHGWLQTEPRCPHLRAKELL